ncbi:MAG TPA: tetratricopeptide repeat protein [Micromonosporaceae bacterium]|nr:tetratricopeptide repeat protein [Micromonosporaceae bacterium]
MGETPPTPRQLPPAVHGFVGRAEHLAELTGFLDSHLDRAGAGRAGPDQGDAVILAVAGPAGVGKTALAIHWAHQVQDRFPDGQLYVDLRGPEHERPTTPEQALDELLRALGVPGEKIPLGVDARAELFRSLLAKRRVLVLLDNARVPEQVNPLLPDSPGCAAIVTSRSSLSGLSAGVARTVPLDRLRPAEAVALLREGIGAVRVDAEPSAAGELARLCDHLPLALRVAARQVSSRPGVPLADLVEELTKVSERDDVVAAGDAETAGARAAFVWSYLSLPAQAGAVFRLLGLHRGPDISEDAAAALTGRTPGQVRELLGILVGGHLVEEVTPGRYRSHDLLRRYAYEAAAEVPEAERAAAVERVLTWYLHTADAAVRTFSPLGLRVPLGDAGSDPAPLAFDDRVRALGWCAAERANLVAAVHHAAQGGRHVLAWQLPAVLWDFFSMHGHVTDWVTTHEVGLASARHLDDKRAQAWMENNLGSAYRGLGQLDEALRYFHSALASSEATGNRQGEGWTRYNIGDTYRELGRFTEALNHLREALIIAREIGERWSQGYTLNMIGDSYRCLGNFDEALRHLLPALVANREIGHRRGEGFTLTMIGDTYRDRGRFEYALNYYKQALALRREIGDRRGEGVTLESLGDTCLQLRRLDQAHDYYQQSLAIRHETGDRRGEARTLLGLGTAQAQAGKPGEARASWQRALAIFEDVGDPQAAQVRAKLGTSQPRLP